ncbi:flagellar assembly protein FliW [Paenibacillus chitinolyticus]|uniref:flagellar assembly protein FliW n=1 Tax=Paenibacillus chitinolyticus TaxID=79263 RepID=UPI001C48E18B|nr:flagellar assembly protein FliW [Paenibacillus chitinolyticus]MBV6716784.1 flagellar assembly protein FliW [Paenibacillus chitinolyticus]
MIIQSTRFGEIEVSDEKLNTFEAGIFGFENYKRYALLQLDVEESVFHILQSLEDADLALVVAEPFLFKPDYEFDLPKMVIEQLGIQSEEDTQVYGIVTVRAQDNVTINLKAPVILNKRLNKAAQIVLDSYEYSLRHPLVKGGA